MRKNVLFVALVVSLVANGLLITYILSQEKYKNVEYQAYKLDYIRCEVNSSISDAKAYEAWKNHEQLPTC